MVCAYARKSEQWIRLRKIKNKHQHEDDLDGLIISVFCLLENTSNVLIIRE